MIIWIRCWTIKKWLNSFHQYHVFEFLGIIYVIHMTGFMIYTHSLDRLKFSDVLCLGLKSVDKPCFSYNLCFVNELIYLLNNFIRLVVNKIRIVKFTQLINWTWVNELESGFWNPRILFFSITNSINFELVCIDLVN